MPTITVWLETITPLFLGGAEVRGKVPDHQPPPRPELRVPSLRGALRYWYRALLGGLLAPQENFLEELHKQEAILFGGAADEKRGIGQSAFSLQIKHPTIEDKYILTYQRENHLPGKNYLYWSMEKTKQEGVDVTARKFIQSGVPFEVVIRSRFVQEERICDEMLASLWLLVRLGGVGSRSRRGAGNIKVLSISGDVSPIVQKLPFSVQADTPKKLAAELHNGIAAIFDHFNKKKFTEPSDIGMQLDVLHPDLCQIYVLDKSFENADEALNAIGLIFQKFRNRRKPDINTVWNSIENHVPLAQPVQRAAFGLPIQFFYKHSGDKATLQTENYERRASPIWFKIERLSNGKYAVVITWFKSAFLPQNEQLKLVHKKKGYQGDIPENHLIALFLTGSDKDKLTLKDNGIQALPVWGETL
jgi:CRISPR-associated protein Cmr1